MAESGNTYTTSNPYEALFGYARALRKGPWIFVSGTTAISGTTGLLQHPDSAQAQARVIFDEIFRAVEALCGQKTDIVRVRMYVKDERDGAEVGHAMKEALVGLVGHAAVAATMICGARFVADKMLVEIEADAFVEFRDAN